MAIPEDRSDQFNRSFDERRLAERRGGVATRVELAPPMARVSWSGVWGGFFLALGIWLVLLALGAAIGLSSVGPGVNPAAATLSGGTTAWLYIAALIALFFGGALGTRLAMVVDGAAAWLEASLIWVFALVLTTALATTVAGIAAAHPAAVQQAMNQAGTTVQPTIGLAKATAWGMFIGMVIAWIVTVLGSVWGRSQARGRARELGLAA